MVATSWYQGSNLELPGNLSVWAYHWSTAIGKLQRNTVWRNPTPGWAITREIGDNCFWQIWTFSVTQRVTRPTPKIYFIFIKTNSQSYNLFIGYSFFADLTTLYMVGVNQWKEIAGVQVIMTNVVNGVSVQVTCYTGRSNRNERIYSLVR